MLRFRLIPGVDVVPLSSSPPAEPLTAVWVEPVGLDHEMGFDEFYRAEIGWARRLAYLMLGDLQAAEDVAHDAFVSISSRFSRVRNPRGYLRVVIVNRCRKHQRQPRWTSQDAGLDVAAPVSGTSLEVLDCIDRLPVRQRAVIVLRYFEGLSEREIAQVLRCRPGTVKSLASRALTQLRKELEP